MGVGSAILVTIRICQALFAAVVLGTCAYATSQWWWSPSQLSFILFCSAWTLIVVSYLTLAPITFDTMGNRIAVLSIDAVTMIFWFAGWIALARFLGWTGCGWGWVSWGPCRSAIAGDVFAAILWLLFLATTIASAIRCGKGDDDDERENNVTQMQQQQPIGGAQPYAGDQGAPANAPAAAPPAETV